MREDYTDITLLLDYSVSMSPRTQDTIKGVTSFIKEQRSVPGKCTLSVVQFSEPAPPKEGYVAILNGYRVDYVERDIAEAEMPPYEAIGHSTALLDAVSTAIDDTGKRLAAKPEHERPGRVLFVVLTDGEENSSRTPGPVVAEKIKHQEDKYNWAFLYLGAHAQAFTQARKYGFTGAIAAAHNAQGFQELYLSASDQVTSYRSTGAAGASAVLRKDISFRDDIKGDDIEYKTESKTTP